MPWANHTVNALPVCLFLLVEECVLVLRQHLLLARHLSVPSLNGLSCLIFTGESCADSVNDLVDVAKALALPGLLRRRETPWGLPICRGDRISIYNHDLACAIPTREDPRTKTAWA